MLTDDKETCGGDCEVNTKRHGVGSGRWIVPETLYHRDDALLYIAYVMLIWAAPIPADRWHCHS